MPNLSFLHSLEGVQKFSVEVPEIIWCGARDYMVLNVSLVLVLGLEPSQTIFVLNKIKQSKNSSNELADNNIEPVRSI